MGINVHVYSYWGVRTEYNEEVSDRIDEIYDMDVDPADDVAILTDGMSGEYMVFGERLYDSGDSRWGEMVNSNEVEINQEILDTMQTEYMQKFKALYPDQYEWLAAKPWRLVNLVHYS
jgi:hypothetical protein